MGQLACVMGTLWGRLRGEGCSCKNCANLFYTYLQEAFSTQRCQTVNFSNIILWSQLTFCEQNNFERYFRHFISWIKQDPRNLGGSIHGGVHCDLLHLVSNCVRAHPFHQLVYLVQTCKNGHQLAVRPCWTVQDLVRQRWVSTDYQATAQYSSCNEMVGHLVARCFRRLPSKFNPFKH